jgi:2',3'-cyclic-nucleotide 2'-phosphodiesterase (5'-nucleotidase family)
VKNADGREIPIVQAGKSGKYMCKVYFDLADGSTEYELMPVNSTYDARVNGYVALKDWLKPFDEEVYRVMHSRIATCARAMSNGKLTYLPNFVSDAVVKIITQRWGKVDFAIMNRGGIRQSLPEGELTEGMISSMLPFDNRLVVMEIKGSDLLEALKVMARRGGDAVSKELEVKYQSPDSIIWAKLNGKDIKPEKTYRMVTVDYLANGGDYMEPLTKCTRLFEDNVPYGGLVLEYIKQLDSKGQIVDSDGKKRMHK